MTIRQCVEFRRDDDGKHVILRRSIVLRLLRRCPTEPSRFPAEPVPRFCVRDETLSGRFTCVQLGQSPPCRTISLSLKDR